MAGCFGPDPEDRARERQLDRYLASLEPREDDEPDEEEEADE
jgi:hypothetical protein